MKSIAKIICTYKVEFAYLPFASLGILVTKLFSRIAEKRKEVYVREKERNGVTIKSF